jgi:O-antigen/teichoic acid export membrane protein
MRRLRNFLENRRGALTLFDQAIVSGSNFASTVILVRGLGLIQFGKFAVMYAILLFALNFQMSCVCAPMLSIAPQLEFGEERRKYLQGMLTLQTILGAGSGLLALIGCIGYLTYVPSFAPKGLICAFAVAVWAWQMQDWVRRYYFAVSRPIGAVMNDLVSYGGQLLFLVLLFMHHKLTLSAAYWTIGITSAAAFLLGRAQEKFAISREDLKTAWHRSRKIARDLTAANLLQWIGSQGIIIFGAGVLGAQAAGGVRAAQNLSGPINIAYQATENFVPVRAAEAMKEGGIAGAQRYLHRFILIGLPVLTIGLLPVAIFAKPILRVLYGPSAVGLSAIVIAQLAYVWLGLPWREWIYFFRTIDCSRWIVWANLCVVITSSGTIYWTTKLFGPVGIVLACVLGEATSYVLMVILWARSDLRGELKKSKTIRLSQESIG